MARTEIDLGGYTSVLSSAFDLFSKLHFRRLHTCIGNFASAKIACRRYVLEACHIRHEARTLISSSIFCRDLFPEPVVSDILRRAASESRIVAERWRIPRIPPTFRRPSGRGRGFSKTPRRSPSSSPAPGPSGTIPKKKRPYPSSRGSKQAHGQPQQTSPAAHPQRDARPPQTFWGSYKGKGPRHPKGPSGRGAPPAGPQ